MAAQSEETKMALMQRNIELITVSTEEIKQNVKEMRQENAQHYVTKEEFEFYKKITYALVSIVFLGVVSAGLNALINR